MIYNWYGLRLYFFKNFKKYVLLNINLVNLPSPSYTYMHTCRHKNRSFLFKKYLKFILTLLNAVLSLIGESSFLKLKVFKFKSILLKYS